MKPMEDLAYSKANIQRIAMVENCFGMSGQPLAKEGRILVGEGILKKECRKKPKLRAFFLFNDILVYGSIVIMNKKYNNQHIIPLEGLTVESLSDLSKIQNRWMIKSVKKSFVVSARSPIEKNEWIRHIEDCVKLLAMKTGNMTTTEHAAPWIPDKATDICMRCTKIKFSLINRRHHCRKCGFVVCGDCSNQRFLIPSISKEPQRVCLLCYKQLLAEEREQAEDENTSMEQFYPALPDYESSSGDDEDSDKSNDDDRLDQWSEQEAFESPVIFWPSFHN